MGWRFRKSVSIIPGVRVNFGLHSQSISIGGRGFRTTYSSTGRVTRSVGLPGTGISYVTSTSNNSNNNRRRENHSSHQGNGWQNVGNYSNKKEEHNVLPESDPEEMIRQIKSIYASSDAEIDWRELLIADPDESNDKNWLYLKKRADDVLNGNIDTYFEIISDINPLDDLLQYGSQFECGTDDPRMLSVHFIVNSDTVLGHAKDLSTEKYNDLLQDYVCACAIRIARDIFALLPIRHVIIDAEDKGKDILSVDFTRNAFQALDFLNIDASDTVESFNHRMSFSLQTGFLEIHPLDN